MRTFVKENPYADEFSTGFSNTWRVLVFNERAAAEKYVEESRKRGTEIIPRSEVPKWHQCEIEPFSRDFIGIRPQFDWQGNDKGFGILDVCWPGSGYERLYK